MTEAHETAGTTPSDPKSEVEKLLDNDKSFLNTLMEQSLEYEKRDHLVEHSVSKTAFLKNRSH
jgi:ethanolamine utilization cobalamin adenosyltransferase